MRQKNLGPILVASIFLAACEGPLGPAGPAGTAGNNGSNGSTGAQGPTGPAGDAGAPGTPGQNGQPGLPGCDGLSAGESAGLAPTVKVSAPKNGMFFAAGEQIAITIDNIDRCGRPVDVAALGTYSLYMAGPRSSALTKASAKLLNCIVDRAAADRQHHFVNLKAPKFLDGTQKNLATTASGFVFTTAPVSDEVAGTYTIGLWAKTADDVDQVLITTDVQIGVKDVEAYATGDAKTTTCASCHLGTASGKSYQAHIIPGFSPVGNYALDQTPIVNCKLCHNSDGYSLNPIVRKVHGAHRGAHQLNPGAAHADYGLGADATLADFTDITFPAFPNNERECAKCHTTDSYLKNPTRLACGTCHDNVFFDTGTLSPPRSFGKPAKGVANAASVAFSCTQDADCTGFGSFVTCDVQSGTCQRKSHPKLTDDTKCTICHSADDQGISPIGLKHDVPSRTKLDGVTVSNVVVSGGTGTNGSFKVGDVPVVKFQLKNKAGAVNVLTNAGDPTYANWSANIIIAGPADSTMQRMWAMQNMKTAKCPGNVSCLVYDANSTTYTFTFPIPDNEVNPGWPARAQLPLDFQPNVQLSDRQVNLPGTYTLWMYVYETVRPAPPNIANVSWRDVSNFMTQLRFGSDGPLQARQIVMPDACNTCHVVTQAHGGSRQFSGGITAPGCPTCHTAGAEDQGVVGTKGKKCTTLTQAVDCAGFNAGYEACQDTNADTVADTCVLIKDPTPGELVDFRVMIHQLHFARKLDPWSKRGNIPFAGKLQINSGDFSEILLPQDVRNCTTCHADSLAKCDANTPCGYGQACTGGTCKNVAWQNASAVVCTSCHTSDAAWGHTRLMTYQDASGPIETCEVCHGTDAEFAVSKVHNITSPYKPPYTRD